MRQALAKIVKGIALGVNSFHAVADLRAASSSSGGPGPWQIRGFLFGSETASTAPRFLDGGRRVAVGSRAGWVRLWSSATGKPVSPPLAAHQGAVVALAISPDGRTLASGGSDGFVRLFDLGSQQPLDARLPVAANTATTPIFVRNGAYLFAITATGRAYRWDLRPSTWDHRACEVAGRQLTRTEWSQVLPDRNHDPAC